MMDGRIFELTNLLNERLTHPWTIEEMAKCVDLSQPHLQKLFKTEIGTPPKTYLRNLRLEKARDMLENGHLQIKQIGLQTGLVNDSHFTRDFKKKFGLTPTEYRKKQWEIEQSKTPDGKK